MPDPNPKSEIEAIFEQEGLLTNQDSDGHPATKTLVESVIQCPDGGTITVTDKCFKCGHPTHSVCLTCHQPFCDVCASILDPKFCKNCLFESGAELQVTHGLKDEDGEMHEGRDIVPKGQHFGTMCKKLSEMSSYELEAHVAYYKDLIRQAELALDFRRIALGAGQLELAQRKDAERRRLRGLKTPIPKGSNLEAMKKAKPSKPTDPVETLAQMLGVPKDIAAKMMVAMMSSGGKK